MDYGFDELIDRMGSNCLKWEFVQENEINIYSDHAHPRHGSQRMLPLWVADMDFRSPPAVIEALTNRARQGIYGYSAPCDSYYEAVIGWFARRYGRVIEREWITFSPGVVTALNLLVQTFVKPGEKVLIQTPVYHPFFKVITNNGAEIASNPLVLEDGQYHMDFADLARKTADPAVKMAILCSPHNPVGRVWTANELARFGQICLENDVLVVSDEIHCDLIYDGHTFTSFAAISEEFARRSIVCTAPSKTFNLAGLKHSNIIIPDPVLREAYNQTARRVGLGNNVFGIVATEEAYKHGEEWLAAVMAYVQENLRAMAAYIEAHLPQLKIIQPQGTYLVWVDFSALGLGPKARRDLLFEQARVYLDSGAIFGLEGANYERINIACPRSILIEAFERIKTAVGQMNPG